MDTYQNYIAGTWQASQGPLTERRNPADTRDLIGLTPRSSTAEAYAAVAAAAAAAGAWRATPAPLRGAIVTQAARLLAERREEIARALTREEGKILSEARGELQRAITTAEFCGAHGRRLTGETVPLELAHNFGYTLRRPLGVVALITPWNFPVGIGVWKLAPALVSGNTVVWKPASLTPETVRLTTQCFVDAGLPPGVLNMVYGAGAEIGAALLDHPDVRGVSFTGSTEVGLEVYRRAAARGIRAQCEMGGKNAVIVMEDAELDLAVSGVLAGAFGSTGQRCTATSRVILMHPIADAFLEKLMAAAAALRPGNPMQADVNLGPCVDEQQLAKVLEYITIGRREGAELLYGGERLTDGDLARGHFVQPTIFDRVRPEMRIAREEIFGPVLCVLRVESFEEALRLANDSRYSLSSSIYTRDVEKTFRYVDTINTGVAHVNAPTLGGEAHMPFGGLYGTGIGPREQGSEAFDFYTQTQAVYIDYTGLRREGTWY